MEVSGDYYITLEQLERLLKEVLVKTIKGHVEGGEK